MSGFALNLSAAAWAVVSGSFLKGHKNKLSMEYAGFSSRFSVVFITSLSLGSINVDHYATTNLLRHDLKPYMKVYIALSVANSGNATTILLNAMILSYTEPHFCIFFRLSLIIILSSCDIY